MIGVVVVVVLAVIVGVTVLGFSEPSPAPVVEAPEPAPPLTQDPRGKGIRPGKQPGSSIDRPPSGSEQVVVKYADGVTEAQIASFEAKHGLKMANEIPAVRARVYDVPAGQTTQTVIGWFTSEPGLVAYAERNGTVQAQ